MNLPTMYSGAIPVVQKTTHSLPPLSGDSGSPSSMPLHPGALFRGVIVGKNSRGQYIISFDFGQFNVQTRSSFKTGQKLDLQVMATKPKLTLQIVQHPLQRRLSMALPLLNRQDRIATLPLQLASLPEKKLPLSPASRQVLENVSRLLVRFQPEADVPLPGMPPDHGVLEELRQYGRHLLEQADLEPMDQELPKILERITRLCKQLPPESHAAGRLDQLLSLLVARGREPGERKDIASVLFRLGQHLVDLGPGTEERSPAPAKVDRPIQGSDLRASIWMLGLEQEHALLLGDTAKARHCLKNVIQEIHHQAGPELKRQAGEWIRIIELFQLIKLELAEDGVTFFPLALPFLDQGYLLVHERETESGKGSRKRPEKTYSLHLSLQGLGNLQIDLVQATETCSIRFFTEDRQRARFMAMYRDELAAGLEQMQPPVIQFLHGVESPEKTLVRRIGKAGLKLVETTV